MKKTNLNPNTIQSLTQMEAIKRHLLAGKTITPLEALNDYGCMRLGARIWDLQEDPHNLVIDKTMVLTKSGKRVAQYSMTKKNIKLAKNR